MGRLKVKPVWVVVMLLAGSLLAAPPAQAAPAAKVHPSHLNEPRGLVRHKDAPQTGPSANPNCKSCAPPLLYSPQPGGAQPVMGGLSGTPGHITVTPVYWAPTGYVFTSTYKSVINTYLGDVAAASHGISNVYSVGTQYYQTINGPKQQIDYQVAATSEIDDAHAFPASCTPATGYTACVSDGALQTELSSLGLTSDDSHLYVVMFPPNVETCAVMNGVTECSSDTYCAYHSSMQPSSTSYLIYTNQPYPSVLKSCSGGQAPNVDAFADASVSLISHEVNESITDWAGAWMDSAGYENGDQCNFVFGNPLGGSTGTFFNQVINGHDYYTQDEFSNEDYGVNNGDPTAAGGTVVPGCVQREELPVASFTAPSVTTGAAATFDGSASRDPDSPGTPLTYDWNWADGSAHATGAKPAHTYCTAGNYSVTLTVTDDQGLQSSTSQSVTVAQGRPVVNSIAPASGPQQGGTSVTIAGCALSGATSVNFGTAAASFQTVSDRQITATAPAHGPTTVDVTVTNPSGTSATSAADHFTYGFNGLYTLDAYGGIHGDDAPPIGNQPYFGWNIARAAKPLPTAGNGTVGLVLDGWGGLHPFGSPAPQIGQEPYYPGQDLARDFVFLPNGTGGYELDGWGGIHPFSIGANPLPPQPWQYPYFPGNDVAKKITLLPDASGGYVLDAFGGIHPWSVSGKPLPVGISQYGYWYGANIARDIWLAPGSSTSSASGYVLDAYGGFHPFWSAGTAAPAPIAVYGYWRGSDIARAMWFTPASGTTNATGYTLDAYGGTHAFAVGGQALPPAIQSYGYWPGQDLAKSLWSA